MQKNVPAEHAKRRRVMSLTTKDRWHCGGLAVGSAVLLAVLCVILFFLGKSAYGDVQNDFNEKDERSVLERCRLEHYVTTHSGHVPHETVELDMKKTDTGTKITGDGFVLAANVDPLDVFVATADDCSGILSPQYVDEPDTQRCRAEQYILAYLSTSPWPLTALPADLRLDTKSNNGVTQITINGYLAFTDVDTAMLLSSYDACNTLVEP